jgi:hypothetical protein
VSDGTDVDVRLSPFEFTFCHFDLPLSFIYCGTEHGLNACALSSSD